jgi:hypothetical protein
MFAILYIQYILFSVLQILMNATAQHKCVDKQILFNDFNEIDVGVVVGKEGQDLRKQSLSNIFIDLVSSGQKYFQLNGFASAILPMSTLLLESKNLIAQTCPI